MNDLTFVAHAIAGTALVALGIRDIRKETRVFFMDGEEIAFGVSCLIFGAALIGLSLYGLIGPRV